MTQYALTQNLQENLHRIYNAVEQAASANADLVLLPELAHLPYFCIEQNNQHFELADTIPGTISDFYSETAKTFSIIIVTTLFEQAENNQYFNSALVFEKDGTIAGSYQKTHIPNDPGYYEQFYFSANVQPFNPIETSVGKLGVLICYDQWFPEAARAMTLAGAEILLYPSAIGFDINDSDQEQIRQRNAWITVQKSHAIANGLPVLFSNRIGLESDKKQSVKTDFWGSSHIVGPFGEVLAKATVDQDRLIVADIDPGAIEQVRSVWPFLQQRQSFYNPD